METPKQHQSSSSTPRTPNSASEHDPYYQASECLRKLKQDISIFRDPNVRSYLQALPLQISSSTPIQPSSSPTSLQSTPAPKPAPAPYSGAAESPNLQSYTDEEKAMIISLRTTVRTMEETVRELEAADLRTRKRAASAEGQLVELKIQHDAQERAHRAAIDEAAQRIRALEADASASTKSAETEHNRLVKNVETSRSECTKLSNQLARVEQRAEHAEERINILMKEINSTGAAHSAEIRAINQARLNAEEREKEVRALLEEQKSTQRTDNFVNEPNHDLQNQNLKLKSEVEWLSKKNSLVQKSLSQAEQDRDSLRIRIRKASENSAEADTLRGRIKHLETIQKQLEATKQLVGALQTEKDEMKRMIVALSSNGDDVVEGVSVLKALGNRQNDREGLKKLVSSWLPSDQQHSEGNDNEPKTEDSDVCMTDSDVTVQPAKSAASEEVISLLSELEQSRAKIASLESELAKLRLETGVTENADKSQEMEKVVAEEGPPDYDRRFFKVLHLVENPLALAVKEAAAKAKAEESLRSKERRRPSSESEAKGALPDVADREELNQLREEVKELRNERSDLKNKAKLGDRMHQVALQRIEQVKSAVYYLFGWTMRINGRVYYLTSMYAQSDSEVLHFCVNEQGGIAMMDSEYARLLSSESQQYVENSFPALLSHVTMSNFKKTTGCS